MSHISVAAGLRLGLLWAMLGSTTGCGASINYGAPPPLPRTTPAESCVADRALQTAAGSAEVSWQRGLYQPASMTIEGTALHQGGRPIEVTRALEAMETTIPDAPQGVADSYRRTLLAPAESKYRKWKYMTYGFLAAGALGIVLMTQAFDDDGPNGLYGPAITLSLVGTIFGLWFYTDYYARYKGVYESVRYLHPGDANSVETIAGVHNQVVLVKCGAAPPP